MISITRRCGMQILRMLRGEQRASDATNSVLGYTKTGKMIRSVDTKSGCILQGVLFGVLDG
jgi:hypothetical protein